MINFTRLFGGAIGALVAVVLAGGSRIPPLDLSGFGAVVLLASWVGAWFVIGFSILSHLTILPARWLIRHAVDLSTGEFVSAVGGLIVGLLIGLLLGLPMGNLPDPYRWILPIGTLAVTGLGMMGLTVAKRHDLTDAARQYGLLKVVKPDRTGPTNGPLTYVDTSALIDGRMTDVVASMIEREVDVNVVRVLQAVAGRMVFTQPRV